ncbi:MAG: hypothetical protein Q8R24_00145 [Legionellaceae bacterium]|nr:hypothetical protein [Legionellaceae bacterium]
MLNYSFGLLMTLWAGLCLAYDANYYAMNPKEMQKALAACPAQQPDNVSCEQLNHMATHVNDLVMELRLDPQAFGRNILAMQETIAKQIVLSTKQPLTPELQAELTKNQQALRDRLIIIKWLESPVGY